MRGMRNVPAVVLTALIAAGGAVATADQNESGERSLQAGMLTAGLAYSCAVVDGGSVRCWGFDSSGQLGDGGTSANTQSPSTAVALGQAARAITAGERHSCALLADGNVRCWGADSYGQLGDGEGSANAQVPSSPVALGLSTRAITAGDLHTCALLADGSVRCWGLDDYGQLGDGGDRGATQTPSAPVALGQAARSISAGFRRTCALLADGTVRCWGNDNAGALGDGGETASTQAPSTPVALGQAAYAIASGQTHSCALLADGSVRCWGADSYGQLGDGGTSANTQAPSTPVALGQTVRAITAGERHSCALLADGTVRCWGADSYGQLGDGGTGADTQAPSTPVALGQTALAIAAGDFHTCALLADGTVRCWGYDSYGELGDGGTSATAQAPSSPVGGIILSPAVADLSLTTGSTVSTATVGDTPTITTTLHNAGPDATAPVIAAPLPAGLTLVSAAPAQGTYATATGLWRPGPIAAGETATLVQTVKATAAGTSEYVAEIADADTPDPDSTPANDATDEDDRATTTITINAAAGGGGGDGGGGGGAAITKAAPDQLTLQVTPRRDRTAPFRYTARGSLLVTTAALRDVCNGLVTLTAKVGKKTVLTQRAPLTLQRGTCRYRAPVIIRNRKRIGKAKRLTLRAAFAGNERLMTANSKARRVRTA